MVWFILLSIYGSLNVLMIAYTSYLIADESSNVRIVFPFLIVYDKLRKRYTKAGSIIGTSLLAPFMLLHSVFMVITGIFAALLGIIEFIWDSLFHL